MANDGEHLEIQMGLSENNQIETEQISVNDDHNILKIVEIMGGIDQILKDCVAQKISDLDEDRLNEIKKIKAHSSANNNMTTTHNKPRPFNKHITQRNLTSPRHEAGQNCNNADFFYEFDEKNTNLYGYFGEEKAVNIKKYLIQ